MGMSLEEVTDGEGNGVVVEVGEVEAWTLRFVRVRGLSSLSLSSPSSESPSVTSTVDESIPRLDGLLLGCTEGLCTAFRGDSVFELVLAAGVGPFRIRFRFPVILGGGVLLGASFPSVSAVAVVAVVDLELSSSGWLLSASV